MEGRTPSYDTTTWECNFSADGYRLPTEAEWEKAAAWDPVQNKHFRFGQHTDGYGLNSVSNATVGCAHSSQNCTTPVGFYDGTNGTEDAHSFYGCYDMTGNAWEWCNDWYDSTYYSSPEASQPNPRGPLAGTSRVVRGGTWHGSSYIGRSSFRLTTCSPSSPPLYKGGFTGFRCAMGAP